jgi:L-ornithine N5-oxygenase
MPLRNADTPVHDVVGVGFGPANLALAVAVAEHNERAGTAGGPVGAVFLERQPSFGWHRGMLLEDATMQVSFLKDLVTLRDPTSRYTFLRYLQSRGRLVDFVNHKCLFPLRVEFHDYLEWAADQVDDLVRYDQEVLAVEPVRRDGTVAFLDVATPTGTYRTRNLVCATGLRPQLPPGVVPSDRVWHNSDLLRRAPQVRGARRFVVVGAGQSAAEVAAYLHTEFPAAEVCAVFARYGYSPADDSPFANRIFDPAAVDDFYASPPDVKQLLVGYHSNTNYSVVDGELIEELYRRVYREKVLGRPRLRICNVSRLVDLVETPAAVETTVEALTTGERTVLDADVVVFATGYRPADPLAVLGETAGYCHRDERGRLLVDRDYRVRTEPGFRCGVYLQGGTEHTHGITSSLLSTCAVRAGEILGSVRAHDRAPLPAPAFVS